MKSVESHHLRALLTSRKVLQRKCIDLENEIRGLLKVFGLKVPIRLSHVAFDVAVQECPVQLCRLLTPRQIEGGCAMCYGIT